MYYWGAKLYYIPESKAYDKLREPGISSIVWSANTRGSWGSPGKFWKKDALRLNLRAFQSQDIYMMCINLKKQINHTIKEPINIIIACTENMITSKSSHLAIALLAATYKILNPPGNKLITDANDCLNNNFMTSPYTEWHQFIDTCIVV